MDRRRLTAIGVVVAAVGAAAAVTLPSFAGDSGAPRVPAGPAVEGADPQVVEALRRDLGLDETQVAARLKTERWASGVVDQLRTELGADYGGSWLSADGSQLNVAVADPAEAARVRAAGAVPKVVERGVGQLDALKTRMDRSAARAQQVSGWYVDVASNSLVVLAQPGAEAAGWRFVARAGVPRQAVRMATEEQPRLFADVRGGEPFFVGAGRCSVGFAVVGGYVTAGHCGRVGARTSGPDGELQGVFRASSFPGDDWAFVQVNSNTRVLPEVTDFRGGIARVAGSREVPAGSSICRSGSTTGVRCGTVQARNATVRYPEGLVSGLVRTNVCAEPGDSGGSWISGNQAQGVTSGGSGDCVRGGTTFYQPINEILQRNNLTLLTTQNFRALSGQR
ncbi:MULTISPECIES: S1 family peptidase [Micromonospora]|uniref:Serine protease n=1 Tax=Micromonospora maris TaxID=1003110 RepID=A0A9X0I887_9ACTN|nr:MULTISPECIES: S1 family peptidase [Micromonospora]AEB43527.1 peptidase S1 and S6 chymotrypsin/Hap [Micromonospora maris AB-18-032]KUJ48834.1 serine protease [Micromonospora maris]RUL92860.1 S1 family peptidase [Verrucosispora sp. FIM060022]